MPEHSPAPSPGRAVYGFAMYLAFRIFFIMYITWAIIPEEYFRHIGITCLPQRYWAVAIPIFLLTVLTVFAFIIYPSLGLIMTPNINDMRTITDKVGEKRKETVKHSYRVEPVSLKGCSCKDNDKCFKEYYDSESTFNIKKPIPVIQDLNIWDVSRHLYLK